MKRNNCFGFLGRFSCFKPPLKQAGESVLEVLLAVAILVTVLTSVFVLLGDAIELTASTKNRVVALNVAREGIEGVRNIRDTNWLTYSGARRTHWLCQPDFDADYVCNENDLGVSQSYDTGYYRLDYHREGVDDYPVNLSSSAAAERGFYFLDKLGPQSELLSDSTLDYDFYQLRRTDLGLTHDASVGVLTPFYRQIYLEVLNPYDETPPSFCDSGVAECNQARLRIVSLVKWREDGQWQQVALEGYLYDYYQRKSYAE